MDNLQNNFTTLEQSKQLLELGLPVWTADMFYENEYNITPKVIPPTTHYSNYFWNFVIPCWSVGRLIEIIGNCHSEMTDDEKEFTLIKRDITNDLCENILNFIKEENKIGNMSFSKLEK